MRIGSVTGTRVARRIVSTLSIARTAATRRSIRSVAIASGSPPLTMTSRTSGWARSHANAGASASSEHGAVAGADHARARAEAAVDCAAVGRQEQDAIGVSLHEMRRDLVGPLAERVDEVARAPRRLRARRERTACEWGTPGRAGRRATGSRA